jgi:hypothetical protein
MNLLKAVGYQPSALSTVYPIGPIVTHLCEGRCCGNRTAPLFVSLGVRGALMLCADCRAWQNRIVRAVLPELRRDR